MLKLGAGLKAFFGLVFAAAAAGAVYVVPQLMEPREASVSEPVVEMESEAGSTAPEVEPPGGDTDSASEGSAEGDTEVASLSSDWVIPRFDVLRVEPDGSTVIAGKAEPGTTLDIMDGETVIASTMVGPSGDFAAVLDTPLAAGDYQLKLRIVGENGAMLNSEEVATVSIPENESGELLAMVSRPGKASRIIAQPSAPEPAEPQTVAQDAPVDEAASETATALDGTPESTDAGNGEAAASDMVAGVIETPELPQMSSELTNSAPEIAIAAENVETDATVATEDAVTIADAPVAGETAGTEIAAVSPDVAETPAVRELPADINVRVDAIEIEGDRIFIAGSATPDYPVKVSADGALIGTATADENGRYIIEAQAELSVGDHIINADLMDESTGTVLLRATVPFNRPEGETLAAVSPAPSTTGKTSRVPAGNGAASQTPAEAAAVDETGPAASGEAASGLVVADIASLSQMREDAFEALAALEAMVSGTDAPDTAKVTAARRAAVDKLKAAAMADLPADSATDAKAIARAMRAQARAALAVIAPEAIQSGGTAGADSAEGLAAMREMLQRAQTALSQPAEAALADEEAQDGGLRTIEQAPLASAPGAVIIRRGDTLWRISRRTYGQGVRYTTIYLANRSQIQNPDRIQPGQVFSVPETPLENAEELHRERLEAERDR